LIRTTIIEGYSAVVGENRDITSVIRAAAPDLPTAADLSSEVGSQGLTLVPASARLSQPPNRSRGKNPQQAS
jgi:hypothetical protein